MTKNPSEKSKLGQKQERDGVLAKGFDYVYRAIIVRLKKNMLSRLQNELDQVSLKSLFQILGKLSNDGTQKHLQKIWD